jgi:ankyrin repeat protein
VVGLLLKRGAAVDPVDALDRTPLHLAAAGGQARVAELLLKGGAKVGGPRTGTATRAFRQLVCYLRQRWPEPEPGRNGNGRA